MSEPYKPFPPAELPLNRFQRWYFNWAESYYQKLPVEQQEQARAIDRFLYSRRGMGAWLGALGAATGCTLGLLAANMPPAWAILVSLLLVLVLTLGTAAAFLLPARLPSIGRVLRGGVRLMIVFGVLGVGLFVLSRLLGPEPQALGPLLLSAVVLVLPVVAGLCLAGGTAYLVVTVVRREQLQKALSSALLQQERDAAAREAAEAKLKLLQAQVQPHFIFNTLSAVQHWVDTGDARASPLLRSLTAFLRSSAELLERPLVPLGEELELARSYLQIMSARLGERLRFELDIEPDCLQQQLPPGLLLTLVENALEHGIAPSLSGGRVDIRARGLAGGGFELQVVDDGVGLQPGWQDGMGLANSRLRLRHQFGERASLSLTMPQPAGGCVARLEFPCVPNSHE
ncbi:MAG: histidine kinase [Burkholderiaceae bacterium]|nr:histidine kinase [Burkholderiaceae bacterium]